MARLGTASDALVAAIRGRGGGANKPEAFYAFYRAMILCARPSLRQDAHGEQSLFEVTLVQDRMVPPPYVPSIHDLCLTLELRQGDSILCSVMREASDVVKNLRGDDHWQDSAGVLFDNLTALVDCRGGTFPPGIKLELSDMDHPWRGERTGSFTSPDEKVQYTVSVVCKSTGRVAMLMPRTAIDFQSIGLMNFSQFGPGNGHSPVAKFPVNPSLRGMLPFHQKDESYVILGQPRLTVEVELDMDDQSVTVGSDGYVTIHRVPFGFFFRMPFQASYNQPLSLNHLYYALFPSIGYL